jgi:hypothetical protein
MILGSHFKPAISRKRRFFYMRRPEAGAVYALSFDKPLHCHPEARLAPEFKSDEGKQKKKVPKLRRQVKRGSWLEISITIL